MESILFYMQDSSLWENITTPFLECNVSNDYNPVVTTSYLDYNTDIIISLLSVITSETFHQNYNNAKQALLLIKNQKNISKISAVCVNFVFFPSLLEEYIDIINNIDSSIDIHNLSNMLCICIESNDSFALVSLQILIKYKGDLVLEIKLLPGYKNINHDLYNYVKKYNIRDIHYDSVQGNLSINKNYIHGDIITQKRSNLNIGFRDVYHLLLYGNINDLQSLIVYWDIWGEDDTAKFACDFYNLPYNCSIRQFINSKCII